MSNFTVAQALMHAHAHRQKGEVEQARTLLQSVLATSPKNTRARRELGSLNQEYPELAVQNPPKHQIDALVDGFKNGDLEDVIGKAEMLSLQFPDSFAVWNILGATNERTGRFEQAIQAFKQAIRLSPTNHAVHYNIGNALRRQGKLDEAVTAYRKALSIKPDYVGAHNNIGVALREQGRLDEAIAAYQRALAVRPDYVEAYKNLGTALYEQHRLDEAIATYRKALSIRPDYVEAHNNMGVALREQGRLEDAIMAYRKALSIKPDYVEAYNNMGVALREQGRLDDAIAAYRKALAVKPDYVEAYNNLSVALREHGSLHEAIRACRQALSINPGYAEAHNSMGNALRDLGQLDEAIDSFNLCIRIKPDHAEAHSNLSHGLLLLGQLAPGFAEYEWRKNTNRPLGNRLYPKPLWTGAETISGKTLLLHHEQGLGDTIQVARYLPRLVKLGARVLLAPQKNLGCLLGNLGEAISIVDADDPTLEYDYHLPMMSLPHAFRTTLETIPNEVPYLFPRSDLVDKWRDRLGADNFKIGICWKGSDGKVDRDRSFNVREFLLLSKIPNVRLISLHKGSGERELQDLPNGMVVETLGQDFDSGRNAFLDTAAVISLCDLVVTSDTAVAHLEQIPVNRSHSLHV
jgi:tetratricopeptide (TPR) repeat protein